MTGRKIRLKDYLVREDGKLVYVPKHKSVSAKIRERKTKRARVVRKGMP